MTETATPETADAETWPDPGILGVLLEAGLRAEDEAGCDCVEAMSFRKSSGSEASDCVEAGNGPGAVLVRDTKDRGTGPVLEFPAGAWAEFTAAVKRSQAAETRP